MDIGVIGGIAGTIFGIAGGLLGTYCSIKNTNGPLEKSFVLKASYLTWAVALLFLLLMLSIPSPYRYWLWLPWVVLLPLGILKFNRKQDEIRKKESNKIGQAD